MKVLLFATMCLLMSTLAMGKDKFYLAVLGNSAVRAALADTQLGEPTTMSKISMIGSSVLVAKRGLLLYLTGFGDMTHEPERKIRFRDRTATPYARHWLSYAIGVQDYSIPVRVQDYLGEKIRLKSFAMMAGTYQNSWLQLKDMEKYSHKIKQKPDLIVVSFMGMDFLASAHLGFKENVVRFYNRLIHSYPDSKILIMGMGNLVSTIIAYDRLIAEIAGNEIRCSMVYDAALANIRADYGIYPGIDPMLPEVDEADNINKSMEHAVYSEYSKIRNRFGQYSEYKGEVAYVDVYGETDGDWLDNMAMDCIHPSKKGQKILGDLAWQEILNDLDL